MPSVNDDKMKNIINERFSRVVLTEDIKKSITDKMERAEKKMPAKRFKKRSVLVFAAVMLSLVMAVSAGAYAIYRFVFIPGEGFVDPSGYEVTQMREVQKIGSYTIESAMLTKNPASGSTMMLVLSETSEQPEDINGKNFKIITDAGEQTLFFSSSGSTVKDGRPVVSYYSLILKDFIDANCFTLKADGVGSADITLDSVEPENVISNTDKGITVYFYRLAEGSRFYVMQVENNCLGDIASLRESAMTDRTILFAQKFYDAAGNEVEVSSDGITSSGSGNSMLYMLGENYGAEIARVEFTNADCFLRFPPLDTEFGKAVYMTADLPVPADGERVEYPEGLVLYENGPLRYEISAAERIGGELHLYQNAGQAQCYRGSDAANIEGNLYMDFGMGGFDYDENGTHKTVPLEGEPESVRLALGTIEYRVSGNWVVEK